MTNRYDAVMHRIGAIPVRGDSFRVLMEADVLGLEKQLGYALPDDYREFICKYGLSAWDGEVRFRNMDDPSEIETSVDVFYGIAPGDTYDLVYKKKLFGERLPPQFLPIASSPGGHIVLALTAPDRGNVYWWSPHRCSPDPRDDMELISRSFDSFVNSLTVLNAEDAE